jgi:hypothetical protein
VELCCVVATLAISALFVRALDARNASAKGGYRKAKQSTGDASEMELNSFMTENRELDAWLESNIPGLAKECPQCGGFGEIGHGSEWRFCECDYGDNLIPHYTTDRADAMEVLERCFEVLAGVTDVLISKTDKWCIECDFDEHPGISVSAETLPLTIALFARQLFEGKK